MHIIFVLLSMICLYIRVAHDRKLKKLKNKDATLRNFFGFGGMAVFPILRTATNLKEKNLIQKANLAFLGFWLFFFLAVFIKFI